MLRPALVNFDLDASLPRFNTEPVTLQFYLASDFVAAKVANNALILPHLLH